MKFIVVVLRWPMSRGLGHLIPGLAAERQAEPDPGDDPGRDYRGQSSDRLAEQDIGDEGDDGRDRSAGQCPGA